MRSLLLQQTVKSLGSGFSRFLDLLLPPHCVLCRTGTVAGVHVCAECLEGVEVIEGPRCCRCSRPIPGEVTLSINAQSALVCTTCRELPPKFDCAVALRQSRGNARELIHRFKYLRQTHLRHFLAGWLIDSLSDPRLQLPPPTALVPVPLHWTRRYQRGFNQAEELAKIASEKLGIPLLLPLRRVRFTQSQTRLDRAGRMENLRNAFALRQNARVRDHHLILIDDVMTTGSTLNECAQLLRRAGAASVRAAAVLRG